jgi:hypothetical protein
MISVPHSGAAASGMQAVSRITSVIANVGQSTSRPLMGMPRVSLDPLKRDES